jgi:glutamyl-tRNA reductase
VQLQEEREESIIRNLKANIYNLLVEAGVAEEQAKELAKNTYKKVKKCIENNKEAEDTIDKMVHAAVDGIIPTTKLDKLADDAVNEAVAELFD